MKKQYSNLIDDIDVKPNGITVRINKKIINDPANFN